MEEEGNIRFGQTPKGTEIMSGPTNDTIPPMTYFYERLSDMGYPMSLHHLDSITADLLIQNGLGNQYYIDIINLKTGEKISGIGTQKIDLLWLSSLNIFQSVLIILKLSSLSSPIPIGFFWSVWDYSL